MYLKLGEYRAGACRVFVYSEPELLFVPLQNITTCVFCKFAASRSVSDGSTL